MWHRALTVLIRYNRVIEPSLKLQLVYENLKAAIIDMEVALDSYKSDKAEYDTQR